MTANIQKLWTTSTDLGNTGNQTTGETYIGQDGRLWYDPVTNTLRASDGNTAGGTVVGSGSSSYGNSNVAAYLPTYSGNIGGNIVVGNLTVDGTITNSPTYGQFWSNATQSVAAANTGYVFTFNNTDGHNNVELGTGASNSRVIINKTGKYNVQFSVQIDKTGGGGSGTSWLWFKKNGTTIPDSGGFFTLDNTIQVVQSWNLIVDAANVGDYVEIGYAATTTNLSFPTIAGNAIVGYPASPSIILTVTPIGA